MVITVYEILVLDVKLTQIVGVNYILNELINGSTFFIHTFRYLSSSENLPERIEDI